MRPSAYNAHETERMRSLHGLSLASFRRRAAAFVLDIVFGGALFILAGVALVYVANDGRAKLRITRPASGVEQARSATTHFELKFFSNWYSAAWWVLYFGTATYFGKGKTPGKRLLGIRVVSLSHDRLSLWHSCERALGYGASALEFGFGFVQYFVHPNRRTVHDRIADTIVVADPPVRVGHDVPRSPREKGPVPPSPPGETAF